jgi:hypothetical protein
MRRDLRTMQTDAMRDGNDDEKRIFAEETLERQDL